MILRCPCGGIGRFNGLFDGPDEEMPQLPKKAERRVAIHAHTASEVNEGWMPALDREIDIDVAVRVSAEGYLAPFRHWQDNLR
jgi:hypothetical protein